MPADHQRTTWIFHQKCQQTHTEQSHTQAVSGGWPVHMQLLSSKVMASHRARQRESHSLQPRKQTTVSHHRIYSPTSAWLKTSTAAEMHCFNYLRTPPGETCLSEKLLVTTWIVGMNDKWNFSLTFIGILIECQTMLQRWQHQDVVTSATNRNPWLLGASARKTVHSLMKMGWYN